MASSDAWALVGSLGVYQCSHFIHVKRFDYVLRLMVCGHWVLLAPVATLHGVGFIAVHIVMARETITPAMQQRYDSIAYYLALTCAESVTQVRQLVVCLIT